MFDRSILFVFAAGTALVAGLPAAVSARPLLQQDVLVGRMEVRESAPGWVGVGFQKIVTGDSARVLVNSVYPSSPADRAGLRVGDRILRVNGTPITFAIMESMGPRIQPGDPYTFTVLRSGRVREVALSAERRPSSDEIIVRRMQTQLDTLRQIMLKSLDTLQNVSFGELPSLQVRQIPGGAGGTITLAVSSSGAMSAPSDSLLRGRVSVSIDGVDHVVRAWTGQDSLRTARLFPARPPQASRAGNAVRVREVPQPRTPPTADWNVTSPLSPYTKGAHRVAGAELHSVGTELGRYLGVDRGLLVVDVTPGTLAARSGLMAGDVVLRADGYTVESLDGLRKILSVPADLYTLEILRHGDRMEIDLRR